MISYADISKLFSFDLHGGCCIEIEFLINEHPKYQNCWMGKMPDKTNKDKEVYWYGLVPDGSEAYDYDNFEAFSATPVFDGECLKDIWKKIEILSIDGCEPGERILTYL